MGNRSLTAALSALSRCPAAGVDMSLAATLPPFPARFTTTEKVAHAQLHRLDIARVTAVITSPNRGCSSRTLESCGCWTTAFKTPTAAPTAPSHDPSLGIDVVHPRHAPPYSRSDVVRLCFFASFFRLSEASDAEASDPSASSSPLASGPSLRSSPPSASSSSRGASSPSPRGGARPSVSTTTASCSARSRSCAVLSWRHSRRSLLRSLPPSLARGCFRSRRAPRGNLCGRSNTLRSSNSALSTCTACVHATVPPPAPRPLPAAPGSGRCVRSAAMNPLASAASASRRHSSRTRAGSGASRNGR